MGKRLDNICRNGLHKMTPSNIVGENRCKVCRDNSNNKYNISLKGMNIKSICNRNWKKRNSNKIIAQSFISNAVRDNRLLKFNFCSFCGFEGYTEFHHYTYECDPSFKNVVEVCKPCHVILDSENIITPINQQEDTNDKL